MSSSVQQWVNHEFANVAFGDARLDQRFRAMLVDLGRHCSKTLASSFETWAGIKAAYRFLGNSKVNEHKMLAPHIGQTAQRAREHDTILSLQDTVYLDYSKREKTPDLDFYPT